MGRSAALRTTVTLIAAAVLASGCGFLPKEAEEALPPLLPPVKSMKEIFAVRRGEITERIMLRAVIAPRNEATVAFKQAGRLKRRYVEAGQAVTEGQLLAELETGNLQGQIELARIALERAELRLEQAQEKAAASKGSMDPYDERFLQLDIRSAHVNLRILEAQLVDARLYAPFPGTVSDVKGNPGEQLGAYQPVITLLDPRTPVIKAEVDDATALKLFVGLKAEVSFTELGDKPVPARLVAVPAAGDPAPPGGRMRQVQLELEKGPLTAKLAETGRAWVVLQEKTDALKVANSAIRNYMGRNYVVVVDGDSRREVDVVVGIVGETESEITRGLSEGQKVMGR